MTLFDYAKQQSDMFNKDPEVEAMAQFTDKIKSLQLGQRDITTKRIRKALLQVLRTAHDVDVSSSAGSDKAPSEDNLEPEEMQMVVPLIEDEAILKRKRGKKDLSSAVVLDMGTSVSPIRKKEVSPLRRQNTMMKTGKNKVAKAIDENSEREEERPAEEQIVQELDDTVTHKKKRKRNVEAKDAWTQTDRSDYMLIKYR